MSLLASRAASLKLMMGGRWWMREPHATGRRWKRWEPGGPVLWLQGAITGQAPCVAFDGLSLASLARQSRAPAYNGAGIHVVVRCTASMPAVAG